MASNLFSRNPAFQTADYKSAGSHQVENNVYMWISSNNVYETLYTVPAGTTFYITNVVWENSTAGSRLRLATGSAGSEVDFFAVSTSADNPTIVVPMLVPIKISGGTRVSGLNTNANDGAATLTGWIQTEA